METGIQTTGMIHQGVSANLLNGKIISIQIHISRINGRPVDNSRLKLHLPVRTTYYHPLMLVGHVFGRVYVSVCVCLSVQAITFKHLHILTSFLV